MAKTTKQKLRPLSERDTAPHSTPTNAIGSTIQFPHPNSGNADGIASSSAKMPMRKASMFKTASLIGSVDGSLPHVLPKRQATGALVFTVF